MDKGWIQFILIILMMVSVSFGYGIGSRIECPYGFNSCVGQIGGVIGMCCVLASWVLILGIGIMLFNKYKKNENEEDKE